MKFYPIILFLFTCLFSCQQNEPNYLTRHSFFSNHFPAIEKDSVITVATYNIRLGFDIKNDPWNAEDLGGGEEHLKKLAAVIRESKADIIALQEVPLNRHNSQIKEYLKALAYELEMNFAYGGHGFNEPYVLPAKGQWGNAILTKFNIQDIDNHEQFFVDEWTRRSMLQAKVKIHEQQTLDVFSLHWYPSESDIISTLEIIQNTANTPIMMGDFNYFGDIQEFTDASLIDVDPEHNTHRIDRIFISPEQFEVLDISVIDTLVSDHIPSIAILKIK